MGSRIRVLLADDHPVVLEGLRRILEADAGLEVFGEVRSGTEALAMLEKASADVVVLDITMPGISGLEVIEEARRRFPSVKILILSAHPEDQFAVRTLRAGAAGYLTKEAAPESLVAAIRKVHAGGKYLSESLGAAIVESLQQRPGSGKPHESLSNREYTVLVMIAGGKTVTEIGDELHLSVKTISTYRSRILLKMGMRTNAELTRYALENGLMR
jgi:two-component system invasion response regulator UvrY